MILYSNFINTIAVKKWTQFLLKDSIYQKNVLENKFRETASDQRIKRDPDQFYRVLNLNNPSFSD